ncbi:hypothetical protein BC936DRAFT_148296 [Jimgerdemannia flammicorona]|uniref:Uncharacterized protein n=1 Tax=Jimgerdemannia flammicorona TaxID=994334 RepID=A0A433D3C7_9FUNG|nr:hypothetical protein BC936DRAFT_148296 [Jimgerdemannia flammicorona]
MIKYESKCMHTHSVTWRQGSHTLVRSKNKSPKVLGDRLLGHIQRLHRKSAQDPIGYIKARIRWRALLCGICGRYRHAVVANQQYVDTKTDASRLSTSRIQATAVLFFNVSANRPPQLANHEFPD